MNIFCKLFGCKQRDCTEETAREVKAAQEDCNRIIRRIQRDHNIEIEAYISAIDGGTACPKTKN